MKTGQRWLSFLLLAFLFIKQLSAQIPQTPFLISPSNGATDVSLTPTLDWSTVVPNVTYRLHIESSSPGDVRVYTTDISSKTIDGGFLRNEITYKWRVKAENAYGESDWTDWWTFTCASLGPPEPISPPDGATDVSITPTLSWTEAQGALHYEVILVEFTDPVSRFYYENISETSITVGPLKYNMLYNWLVKSWGFPHHDRASTQYAFTTTTGVAADFSASPTSGMAPLTVRFTDQSSGTITGRSWNFGDGKTSTVANPSHIYFYDGIYTVSLTVSGSGGSNTKTRIDYITVSDNMLRNGNFSDGTDHWPLWLDPSVSVSGAVQDDAYVVTIANGGSLSYNTQLTQLNLKLENGETYDVSFDAWADAPRQIIPYMTMGSSPWTTYGGYQPVTLSTEKQNFTYSFTMNHPTDPNARIAFDVGASNTDVTFDNMFLTKRKPSNMLFNGAFSHGVCGWDFYVFSPAVASGATKNGEYQIAITNGGANGWDVHLQQQHVLIETGVTYNFSFDAYAASPRQIIPFVAMSGDPWTIYGYRELMITTAKQTYSYSFTMSHATNPDTRVVFDVGNSTTDVVLDNIILTKGNPSIAEQGIMSDGPGTFILYQNYPNPFNPSTKIRYHIAETSKVTFRIFDVLGKEIESLVNEVQSPGRYTVTFHAHELPSGIYFYRLDAGSFSEKKKLILLQ